MRSGHHNGSWKLPLFAALLAALAGRAHATPCQGGAETTVFGEWRTINPPDTELSASHRLSIVGPFRDARYLRVLLDVREAADSRWHITVRDAGERVVQTLGPSDFANGTALTARHEVDELRFELSPAKDTQPSFALRQVVIMPEKVSGVPYYSKKDPNVENWNNIYKPSVAASRRNWGDNVGFVMVGVSEGRQPAACSGIALPPHYFLTNWHCGPVKNAAGEVGSAFWRQAICDRTLIDLSWDDDKVSREFICESVLAKDELLDYALLKVRPLDHSRSIAPVTIALDSPADKASLVHHPAAEQKKISQDCRIIDRTEPSWRGGIAGATFTHDCDSENGSSGAPVFDNSGQLIGLHHRGHELLSDGRCDEKNKAVWICFILDDLARQPESDIQPEDIANLKSLIAAPPQQ